MQLGLLHFFSNIHLLLNVLVEARLFYMCVCVCVCVCVIQMQTLVFFCIIHMQLNHVLGEMKVTKYYTPNMFH